MQKGFTLLEVIFSLLILTILIVGVDALQLISLQKSKQQLQMAIADNQLQNIREKLFLIPFKNKSSHQDALDKLNKQLLPNATLTITNEKLTLTWGIKSLQELSLEV